MRLAVIYVMGAIALGIVWMAICLRERKVDLSPTAGDPRD